MSEMDYVEPSSESFWEIGQYKRTVKRCEDGYKLCNDIMQMITERADLEKQYSKSLKAWSKRWNDYLQKGGGNEYGTMKQTWMSSLLEADKLGDIHLITHNVLIDELNKEIKEWQKLNYPKSIVNQLKTAKEYEEEFKKAQKPWAKKYSLVEKTKKDYHSACKSLQTGKVQYANSQNDPTISVEQKKKFEDKVEKYKKEVEITKSKYKQSLEDLNSYNSHYIEDMNNVYKKCDLFEKERLEFFIQRFIKLHGHLNIYDKMNIEDIYSDFLRTIKQTNTDKDLLLWSKEFGSGMPMNWPIFEEYSEELKTIAKGNKSIKKEIDNNGVTITSIKHKTDDLNRSYLSANQSSNNLNNSSQSNKSISKYRQSQIDLETSTTLNPFDEEDEENSESIEADNEKPTKKSTSAYKHQNDNNNIKTSTQRSSSSADTINNNQKKKKNFEEDDEQELSSDDDDNDDDSSEQGQQPVVYLNVKVKALYEYKSIEDDELSFKAGQEFIKIANEDDRGWCLGKLGSKIGLYPATYAAEV